jgi:phosphate transport system substrate-binding protein
MKKWMTILICATLLTGCGSHPQPTATPGATTAWMQPTPVQPTATVVATPTPAATPAQSVQPDRTSWGSITEMVVRPAGWKQIVQDSAFTIGEKKKADTWEGENGPEDYYAYDWGTYPRIDGSTVCVPLAAEFARQHLGLSDSDVPGFICFSTTHYAYENLILRGPVYPWVMSQNATMAEKPVAIVTEPSDDEQAMAKENDVELVVKPVCRDAFVFITHKDNPVDSLTAEQIRGIYSGKITNWKEVGGDDRLIIPFQRDENSGSQTTMEKQVMRGEPMLKPEAAQIPGDMGELVDSVAEYRNGAGSIGYTFKFYIETLYKNEDIKMLYVDGVAPVDTDIRSEAYPFSVYYYGVIRGGEEKKTGGLFLDWVLSDEGQRCVKQAGYCPL